MPVAIAIGLALVAFASPVWAQGAPGTLSLTVSPLVVEFRVAAGDTAAATVTVRNDGSSEERIVAQSMDWRVAGDGAVRVEQPGTEGRSSIANFVRIEPADVVLAPGESRQLALTLDLPASFFQATAVYRSGFLVRAVPTSGPVSFAPAATVVVYDTVGTPRSHVSLTELHVSTPAAGTMILSTRIKNDGDAYARMSGRLILRRDGEIVADRTESIPVLFANEARRFAEVMRGLPAGTYSVSFTLDYGGPTLIDSSTEVRIR
jgi:hypothetical protein